MASNDLAFAIRDVFPVSEGHTLVIPFREIPTWWDATPEERAAIFELVDLVRAELTKQLNPDGFNVGFNEGTAAGQTIDHLHVHVIPRFGGDVPDPTGGVRNVIPGKGNYLIPPGSDLHPTRDGRFYQEFSQRLQDPSFTNFDLIVAFVMASGVKLINPHLIEALERGVEIRLLTTDYLLVSDPGALGMLLDISLRNEYPGSLEVRVFSGGSTSFHPKGYIFSSSDRGVAFVGSSNLSASGLRGGIEWNMRSTDVGPLLVEFDVMWTDPRTSRLTDDWLSEYATRKAAVPRLANVGGRPVLQEPEGETEDEPIEPTLIQREALAALEATRHDDFHSGLVVMATGLGKTWLAAFDSTRPEFRKILFIAHRKEILEQSRAVFRRVNPMAKPTMYVDGERDLSGDVVFASIQSLHTHLDTIETSSFDYVVCDEFHHAVAPTYREVLAHLSPSFLLGLTATPNRADNADLLALCADNLVYQCDLVRGIELNLLSMFRYRAIKDVADYAEIPWHRGKFDIEALSEQLETIARADQVFDEWSALGGAARRTLAFCCTVTHADFMASYFRGKGIDARAVHTGPTSSPRISTMDSFREGEVPIIFSVDLFNEGIDVPELDFVLMLRPTESPIVFLQQLGRGLRISEGKTHLDVIDLVGNHRSFLSKMKMLTELAGIRAMSDRQALERVASGLDELPEGCSVIIETEVIDLLQSIVGTGSKIDRYEEFVREWMDEHEGIRPTALQLSLGMGSPIELPTGESWFGFLESLDLLSPEEIMARSQIGDFLVEIEKGAYTKSFKLVTLKKLMDSGGLRMQIPVKELARSCRWEILNDPRLAADLKDANSAFADRWNPSDAEWIDYWLKNPIAAWTRLRTGDRRWFDIETDEFRFTIKPTSTASAAADEMVSEIVEYRLHRYLRQQRAKDVGDRRNPLTDDGTELNAAFRVVSVREGMACISIESAGAKLNSDYGVGLDVVLRRLSKLDAVLIDCLVDSSQVQGLAAADRRVKIALHSFPVRLAEVSDLVDLRKAIAREVRKIGRKPSAKGNGNGQKKLALYLSGLEGNWPNARLADHLAGISEASSESASTTA